jgi:hypothetical protein
VVREFRDVVEAFSTPRMSTMDSLLPPRSGGTLSHLERAFTSVGWFIPPYAAHGYLGSLGAKILNSQGSFTQDDLESALGSLYSADGLAAMVCSRYPITPVIVDYEQTIAEAIEAHFLGCGGCRIGACH